MLGTHGRIQMFGNRHVRESINFLVLILILPWVYQQQTDWENAGEKRSSLEYSRYIWSFYDPFDSPGIHVIQEYTSKVLTRDWNYRFLTNINISQYLNQSTFPKHYTQLSPAHQADYLRLRLAEKYGGWWIDGDMLVTNSSYFESLFNILKERHYQFFACCVLCPRKAIENGFFYAPKGSIVVREWLSELEREHSIGQTRYHYDIDQAGVTTTWASWEHYPKLNTYLSAHAALQYTLERRIPRHTPILIQTSGSNHYKLLDDCYWKVDCVRNKTFEQFIHPSYPITKYIHSMRDKIWPGGQHVRWSDKEPYTWKPGAQSHSDYLKRLIVIKHLQKTLEVGCFLSCCIQLVPILIKRRSTLRFKDIYRDDSSCGLEHSYRIRVQKQRKSHEIRRLTR